MRPTSSLIQNPPMAPIPGSPAAPATTSCRNRSGASRNARVIRTEKCKVPLDAVLDKGAFDLDRILALEPAFLEAESHDHDHDHHHHGHDHGHHHHEHGPDCGCGHDHHHGHGHRVHHRSVP